MIREGKKIMARSEYTKKSIAVATARFVRKAAGRITKREAAKLGRLYGEDIHWKFLGSSGDRLEGRKPGDFAEVWKDARWCDSIANAFKSERRAPNHFGPHGKETTRHLALFCWYGPSSGCWPGEKFVFNGTSGARRVVCGLSCARLCCGLQQEHHS